MTVIRTMCTNCSADLEMAPADLHLVTYDRGDADFYEFVCPDCGDLVQKPADVHVIRVLRFGKVPETRRQVPAELLDPQRREGGPFTPDDLLDFALALQSMDSVPPELEQ